MSASPTTSGARTCTEDHGKRTPPNVSPTIARVVPAMIIKLPLKTNVAISLECATEAKIYSQPVHPAKFSPYRPFWGAYPETQEHQRKGDCCHRKIEVCNAGKTSLPRNSNTAYKTAISKKASQTALHPADICFSYIVIFQAGPVRRTLTI